MGLPRRLYRTVRPFVARATERSLGWRVVTRDDLLEEPPDGCTVLPYGSAERYQFDRPRHLGDLPPVIAAKLGTHTVPAPFVVECADATVIGPDALVAVDGRLLLESVLGSPHRLVDASTRAVLAGQLPLETRLQPHEARYDEPVFSLVGPWATDYYHWLTDYLVQVFALESYRERAGVDPLVLIPSDPPSWLGESLSLAGVDPARWVEWSGTRVRCSRLAVGSVRHRVTETAAGYVHSPAAMARLGERIVSAVGVDDTDERSRRLYVSRADAPDRRIRNEDELTGLLEGFGFERIVPGEHSVEEQVRRFAGADVVLGPHGAGLTNLVFSRGTTTLVELFGSYQNACFFTLAAGMGHEYVSVDCRADGADLVADVGAIRSLCEDLFGDG